MDLRIHELGALDPLAVPLPNGTEVTTRVDRVLSADRRVPQGAVGRVVAQRDGELDVMVVGVGVLRYARSELVPRKIGQVRWARRRAGAWDALRPCTVLEATVGSRAWGLADEGSDHDQRGVFVLPFAWTLGLGDPPRDLVSTDGSATYWEAGKAVRQALRADPNTLELLFVRSARALDPMGEWILAERDAFVSADIHGSFGRYALSQLKRLVQSQRLAKHRVTVLEWLREDPAPTLDQVATRLAKASPRVAPTEADAVLQAKDYVKQLYRSLHDQGLMATRDYPALVRFAREHAADFDMPRELRPKNAYNLVRLIGTAIHWLETGEPELEVHGELRDLLLAIKKGQVSLDETLREAETRAKQLEAARQATKLPAKPDAARADALLCRIGAEAARRSLAGDAGPFGRDAPERPEIELDEEETT
ncbi:Undecaprenyl-phosphate N-acetylglucosaminyl 1-phosphate transferase [Minicystis rosea]|nr:Undecaprenyl-phosphate N-acetylglucosaminyl 1-phosphate transferase [Minicystis rosea]